jgi:serine/threonine protein kinase
VKAESNKPLDVTQRQDETRLTANMQQAGDTKTDGTRGDAAIPDSIGRFKILDLLGRGGMGAVYLAFDEKLDRKIAIKVPEFKSSQSASALTRFYREARAAAKLTHPNLCQVYDVGEADGQHYIAMAYIQGHTLNRYIDSDRKNDPKTAAVIIRKIARAMEEAHQSGIIHRDIKPANIMLNNRREPIVMDFGLAYPQEDSDDQSRLTQHGSILGSPAYMAPEQLKGEVERIGKASDVYSLGVVFYELLCGQIPYPGTGSTIALISRVLTENPVSLSELRPDIDATLIGICERAMHKDITQRYKSMKEFADAIGGYLKGMEDAARVEDAKKIKITDKIESAKKLCESKQFAAALHLVEEVAELTHGKDNRIHSWALQQVVLLKGKVAEANRADVSLPSDGRELFGDFVDLKKDELSNSATPLKYQYEPQHLGFWSRLRPKQRQQIIFAACLGGIALVAIIILIVALGR